MSSTQIFRDKMSEIYTPEEVLESFDSSFAFCIDSYHKDNRRRRVDLFADITRLNPDVMIIEVDCCVMHNNPIIKRKQTLIINRNSTKEISAQMMQLLNTYNITSDIYKFFSEKKYGVKGGWWWGKDRPNVIMIGNLLEDDGHYVLTIRHGFHERKK